MITNNSFEVKRYDFNPNVFYELQNFHSAKDLWPIVYILSDGSIKVAYVGETTDTYARLTSHLSNSTKNQLSIVHLITSEKFNKSATLDIESNLIKYISGDGQYKLLNGNLGLANHNYYQKKEVYWDIFKSIWQKLRAEGIAKNAIEQIDNSDLFKYSPYKSLSFDQRNGLLKILKGLLDKDFENIVIEGGAGTGKTILAIFLFKLLNTKNEDFNFKEFGDEEDEFIETIIKLKERYPNPKMALVIPMTSFRSTIQKVFKNIKDLNANMVIGPTKLADDHYDIIVVDESHRLRRRVNLGSYYRDFDITCSKLGLDKKSCSELEWVTQQSDKAILFYDENQSVKPSDVKKEDFDKLKSYPSTKIDYLSSQFRVKGGNGYVRYVDNLLNCQIDPHEKIYNSKEYEFLLFDAIEEMINEIKLRDSKNGLSRLIAGFSWPWISNKKKNRDKINNLYDIKIESAQLKWNSVPIDFINSPNAINEVGCIHTTQGYDLNYAGIIFGNEITYDKVKNQIVIIRENYHDKNGKITIHDPAVLKDFIINIYKTIMLRGIKGTYVYVCDKNLREYFARHIDKFQTKEIINYPPKVSAIQFENSVPVFDLRAAAGSFSELQNVNMNELDWVQLPAQYKTAKDLFACTVLGESMNKVIPNGSICLFRKYTGGSRNGKIVLVEHTNIQDPDFGSGYTVKEYWSKKNIDADQWTHESIILKPLSNDSGYTDIVITEDELSYVQVIGIFECVL